MRFRQHGFISFVSMNIAFARLSVCVYEPPIVLAQFIDVDGLAYSISDATIHVSLILVLCPSAKWR